ncbi:hypothetical protein LZQ00_06865 [Sphingobacterium sp. SRCM116780]|uniref:DUF6714 family protein n=1 Tax=Sphingobacterium sp. SRCM116780 TaxID=2907623 RepID=UPI001F2D043B|nr:DUF6714 family protein [Sphingobacterium sp. SRCM116780]UIR57534.1 hypothetical protein LZQ00_06865 [Sphingobacterium sp. SRCM116780]
MTKIQLINKINQAFVNVHLEDGIGMYEADCIDDYLQPTDIEYITWKAKDERVDWQKLLPIFLSDEIHKRFNSSCWTFMDAKGKRFILPCFLLQELEKPDTDNPIYFALTYAHNFDDFRILNPEQIGVIIDFLNYKLTIHLKNNDTNAEEECKKCLSIVKEKLL